MLTLKHDDKLRVQGHTGFFTVFTYAGYCKRYNEDPAVARERDRRNGHDCRDLIAPTATVMTAERDGMMEWNNAKTVRVGDLVQIEGTVRIITKGHNDHFPLEVNNP